MDKFRAFVLAGFLALAAPSAFAIPFSVEILGGTGSWELDGPSSVTDSWFAYYNNEFDIAPGVYSWNISGVGAGFAGWSLFLNDDWIYSGYDAGFIFRIRDDYSFEAIAQVQVPEPATLSLLGIALGVLGFSIRRSRLHA